MRVQTPPGAHDRRRLTSPPKMTGWAAERRARSAASSAHCASFPATSMLVRVFRWAVHTSTPSRVVTHSHLRRSGHCPELLVETSEEYRAYREGVRREIDEWHRRNGDEGAGKMGRRKGRGSVGS